MGWEWWSSDGYDVCSSMMCEVGVMLCSPIRTFDLPYQPTYYFVLKSESKSEILFL